MIAISSLYVPIRGELAAVEATLQQVAKPDTPWLAEMLAAVLFKGGKRMRPAVALLAGRFGGFRRGLSVPLAAALELLHTASLVHDDIIDSAGTRRGRPTASSLFDNHAAVVLGDYIFAVAAALVAQTGNTAVTSLFAQTMIAMAQAELSEDRSAFQYDQDMDDYLRRIKGKTASLFAVAAQGGALVAEVEPAVAASLHEYGENLGMEFQIVDDILDFSGDEREMGKPVGSDLMQGTLTLPSLLLVQRYPEDNTVRRLFEDRGGNDLLPQAIAMVRETDILEKSYEIARGYRDRACDSLSRLPQGAPRAALEGLTDYVLERRT
jgi:octaprenyl-diphosphate synthase